MMTLISITKAYTVGIAPSRRKPVERVLSSVGRALLDPSASRRLFADDHGMDPVTAVRLADRFSTLYVEHLNLRPSDVLQARMDAKDGVDPGRYPQRAAVLEELVLGLVPLAECVADLTFLVAGASADLMDAAPGRTPSERTGALREKSLPPSRAWFTGVIAGTRDSWPSAEVLGALGRVAAGSIVPLPSDTFATPTLHPPRIEVDLEGAYATLSRVALWRLRDRHDAEDAVQHALQKSLDAAAADETTTLTMPYLMAALRSATTDALKRRSRGPLATDPQDDQHVLDRSLERAPEADRVNAIIVLGEQFRALPGQHPSSVLTLVVAAYALAYVERFGLPAESTEAIDAALDMIDEEAVSRGRDRLSESRRRRTHREAPSFITAFRGWLHLNDRGLHSVA